MQIYKVTNIVNGRFYIGKEKRNNKNYLGSGIMINNAIRKYGKENFKKEIIQVCETENEWNNAERYWIKELNSFYPIGYNIGEGGEGGDNISKNPNKDIIIKKMKQAHKEEFRPYLTDEQRKRKSESSTRLNNLGVIGRKGLPHTEETKKKMSESAKQYTKSSEHCKNISKSLKGKSLEDKVGIERAKVIKQKISEARKGVPRTEETKQKLSKALKGKTYEEIYGEEKAKELKERMKEHIVSPETKLKISLANKGKVRTEEQRKNMSIYLSGIKRSPETRKKISEGLKGKPKSAEHNRKNSESQKGKHHTPETKEKIRQANSGEKNYFYGKHHTEESKQKIRETMKMRFMPYVSPETRKKMSEARKKHYNKSA